MWVLLQLMSSHSSTDPSFETHTRTRARNQLDDNKNMHGSLTPSSPRSLLQLNHSHPVKPVSSPRGVLLTKWSLSQLTHNVFYICDKRVVELWSQAKVAFEGAAGGSFFHVCAFWVCSAFAAPPLPRPWKWGRSDQADSLFPNKQRLACCLTHIPILPDRLSEAGYKGTGVVKTWHSQKRAAGPKVNQETSHMTQRCRNDRTARVSDEGPLKDIASFLYFCPTASEIILELPWVWANSLWVSGPVAQGYLSSTLREGQMFRFPAWMILLDQPLSCCCRPNKLHLEYTLLSVRMIFLFCIHTCASVFEWQMCVLQQQCCVFYEWKEQLRSDTAINDRVHVFDRWRLTQGSCPNNSGSIQAGGMGEHRHQQKNDRALT